MRKVTIIQESIPHYRVAFFTRLREILTEKKIYLEILCGAKTKTSLIQGDLPWAKPVLDIRIGGLHFQNILFSAIHADLTIVAQGTRFLSSHLVQVLMKNGGGKYAIWGHGKNFQSRDPNCMSERINQFLTRRADWYFAYNDLSVSVVESLGFPRDRVTNVQNAVDTKKIRHALSHFNKQAQDAVRLTLGIRTDNVGIYSGGLYPDKRIHFLLDCCKLIKQKVPDFELIMLGNGPDANIVAEAARANPWIHYLGAQNDEDKIPFWSLARVSLNPGLVGLVVLDAFAFGVPLLTTAFPYHSPEISYLQNGENGIVVQEWQNPTSYADAVASLLRDTPRLQRMALLAHSSADQYTIENMAQNFARGVLLCLSADKRRSSK